MTAPRQACEDIHRLLLVLCHHLDVAACNTPYRCLSRGQDILGGVCNSVDDGEHPQDPTSTHSFTRFLPLFLYLHCNLVAAATASEATPLDWRAEIPNNKPGARKWRVFSDVLTAVFVQLKGLSVHPPPTACLTLCVTARRYRPVPRWSRGLFTSSRRPP